MNNLHNLPASPLILPGNLTSYANAQASGTMTYDPAGRKSSESVTISGVTKSFSYTYDPQGNKASYTSPEGINHSYQHDKAGKLTGITFDGQTITLNYDKTRLKQIGLPNGVTTDYAYNAANWLTGITTTKAGNTLLSRGYNFDDVGNITGRQSEHGPTGYGYDDLYQLTSADHPESIALADEAYGYDKVGNRITSAATTGSWSYNKNNELQSSVTTSYEYDANGNTVKKIGTGSGEAVPVPLTTLYAYDARNRLTQVTLSDGTTASYAYDPFGRRVKKAVDTTITLYTYADEGLIGEYDASGSVQTVYAWKPDGLWGTDPLYLKQNGVVAFYHNDHLGTPQKLTDGEGSVVWSATYAAFGAATVDASATVTNNLRFPGQYFDAETGGHYNYFRYFSPMLGKYSQKDPIGFAGGDWNLYNYVWNRPTMFIDALGLHGPNDKPQQGSISVIQTGTCHYYESAHSFNPKRTRIYVGGSVQGATHLVAAGLSGSEGLVVSPDGRICESRSICQRFGLGAYYGSGAVASFVITGRDIADQDKESAGVGFDAGPIGFQILGSDSTLTINLQLRSFGGEGVSLGVDRCAETATTQCINIFEDSK